MAISRALHIGFRLKQTWAMTAFSLIFIWCGVDAQDFSVRVTNTDPLGLRNVVTAEDDLELGFTNGIKGQFLYGIGVNVGYDSNLFLREDNPENEMTTSIAPWITYASDPEGGATFSMVANYAPVARLLLNNSDLNGIDQSGDVRATLKGAKTQITTFVRYAELSGTDRLTSEFITGSQINTGIQATYQIAPRTSLQGDLSHIKSDYGDSEGIGSDVYAVTFGGLWAATERLSVGPVLSYSHLQSDNIGSADAWTLAMRAQYLAGQRIRISASFGLEHAKYSDSAESNSTLQARGDLQASYAIDERWSWFNNLSYVTVPSPTEQGYVVNNLALTSTLSRSLLRGSCGFGTDLNISSSEPVDSSNVDIENENTIGLFVFYNRTLISDRVFLNTRTGYSMNHGQQDWSRFTISADVSIQF